MLPSLPLLTPGSTKKAATTGAIFTGYVVGNVASSYTVIASEVKVKYQSAWITVIVSMFVSSVCSLALRFLFIRENKRRDALLGPGAMAPVLDGSHAGEHTDEATLHDDEKDGSSLGLGVDVDAQAPPIKLEEYEDRTDQQIPEFRYVL